MVTKGNHISKNSTRSSGQRVNVQKEDWPGHLMKNNEGIEGVGAVTGRENGKQCSQKCSKERDLYQEHRMEMGWIGEPCYF